MSIQRKTTIAAACTAVLLALACHDDAKPPVAPPPPPPPPPPQALQCSPGDGGITLPVGFCAIVVADLMEGDSAAKARHMAITPSGDIFVAINSPRNVQPAFGIIGLRDNNGDGRADDQSRFSPGLGGSGIAWSNGQLFFGANDRVLRYALPLGQLSPDGDAAVVVAGLPDTGDHISKTLVLRDAATLFVNIGSASNSCQQANRQAQSPGLSPCPELDERAGVWMFDPNGSHQTASVAQRYATGLRNMVALAINPANQQLYGVQHGRDMLFENWPQFFGEAEDAVLPSEEFIQVAAGSDNGWPYCFHDGQLEHKKLLAPEYGGDGFLASGSGVDCATRTRPLATFGAHWAPNGLAFYGGTQFPARYRGGAFIAFHGGFDRAPLPNEGFKVMFVPMAINGVPSGAAEVFADGFAGSAGPLPASAVHRPVGVTEGPDGSLYISDDRGGRIWRVIYRP